MSKVNLIYNGGEDTKLNVIYLHGLGGDPVGTWKASSTDDFWPLWVGEETRNSSVYCVGYDANPTGWQGGAMPLQDRANELIETLRVNNLFDLPVVFVVHSLGGLLFKQMIRQIRTGNFVDWHGLRDQFLGVVFIATPHSGSEIPRYLKALPRMLRINQITFSIERNEPALRELNVWFRNNYSKLGLRTRVFCETHKTYGVMVVDQSSADPGIPGLAVVPIDHDHIQISRPTRSETVYLSTVELIKSVAANLEERPKLAFSARSKVIGISSPVVITVPTARSTNDEAFRLINSGQRLPFVLHTWSQTHGRGKRERVWLGGAGSLTASWVFEVPCAQADYEAIGLVSIVSALAVADAIDVMKGTSCSYVKWPNDVILGSGKVAGILVEIRREGKTFQVVIGIGVNVSRAPDLVDSKKFAMPPSSIYDDYFDDDVREARVEATLIEITKHLGIRITRLIVEKGIGSQLSDWKRRDFLRSSSVQIHTPNSADPLYGIASGINRSGQLRVIFKGGVQKEFFSGEVMRVVASDLSLSEVQQSRSEARAVKANTKSKYDVVCPMVGSVLNIEVKIGDRVTKGDVLYYLEAMKTSNRIVAEIDMEIWTIHVQEGDSVDYGEIVMRGKPLT